LGINLGQWLARAGRLRCALHDRNDAVDRESNPFLGSAPHKACPLAGLLNLSACPLILSHGGCEGDHHCDGKHTGDAE